MPKRKQASEGDDASSSSDVVGYLYVIPHQKWTYTPWKSLVDVSFDFFDPNPKVDYHAIKRLLTQLLQRDAEELRVHELAELILSQPTVGTTIKTDGIESDPFALFTVLNMHLHHVRLSFSQYPCYAENTNVNTTAKSLDKGHRQLPSFCYVHPRHGVPRNFESFVFSVRCTRRSRAVWAVGKYANPGGTPNVQHVG